MFLFLSIIGQENVFYDILERKNAFLGYKNSIFKKWKICDFWKGVNPWFWSKIGHFSIFCLVIIGQENMFYDSLERKSTFLGYKNSMFKKWKNCDVCKGANPWFWSKIGYFSIFFSQAIQASEMCFTIFQNEKTPFQAIKTATSTRVKISIFPKGLTHGFGPKFAIFPCFVLRQYRPGKCVLRYSRTKKCLSRL